MSYGAPPYGAGYGYDATGNGTVSSGVATLGPLSLSSSSFTIGTPASGTINGATSGSTVVGSGLPTGFTINGPARTWAYSGAGSAATTNITLTETLAGATNTPNASNVNVTISAAAVTLGALTFSTTSFTIGTSVSGTINGATAGSVITSTGVLGLPTGLTINSAARTFAYDGSGSAATRNITLTETLAGATNTPLNSSFNVTIAAAGTVRDDHYGMNFDYLNIPYTNNRAYNNLVTAVGWRDSSSTPLYKDTHLDRDGNVILMPAGNQVFTGMPRPGPLSSYRLKATWTGPGVVYDIQGYTGQIISQSAGNCVFTLICPASPDDAFPGVDQSRIVFANSTAANPIMGLRVFEVDGSDNPIQPATELVHSTFRDVATACKVLRFLGAEGNGAVLSHKAFIPITPANATPLSCLSPNGYYTQASLTHGSGTSVVRFTAMEAGSDPNWRNVDAIAFAKQTGQWDMLNATGAAGNKISITIAAASSTPSVTVTRNGPSNDLFDIVITPKTGATLAAHIANQVLADPVARCLVHAWCDASQPYYSPGPGGESGWLVFSAQPAAGATITLAGTVFTFVASGASGNQINIGANTTATLDNAVAVINAASGTPFYSFRPYPTRLDVAFLSGTTTTLAASSGANVSSIRPATADAAPGTLAKTFLSGGTDPINPQAMSVERAVQICAESNTGLHWNYSANTTVAQVTAEATYARDNLPAAAQFKPEIGNEVWNDIAGYYFGALYLTAIGFRYNAAPTEISFFGATLYGYSYIYKRNITAQMAVFAGNPAKLDRVVTAIQTGAGPQYIDNFLQSPANGGNANLYLDGKVDTVDIAPYHGQFGPTNYRGQYASGVTYNRGNHGYDAATGIMLFFTQTFTATNLAADMAARKVLNFATSFYEPEFDQWMYEQIALSLELAKTNATRIHSYVNDRGNVIRCGIYECGQSDRIQADGAGIPIYDAAIRTYYRSAAWLRWEGYYLGALRTYSGCDGTINYFVGVAGRKYENGTEANWGSMEFIYSPDSERPKFKALANANQGIFPAYFNPGAVPTFTGGTVSGTTRTINIPPVYGATSVLVRRKSGATYQEAAVERLGQASFTYAQVVGDEGKTLEWEIVGISTIANLVYTTSFGVQTTAPLSEDPATTALLARMTVQPSAAGKDALNAFIIGLKSDVFSHPSGESTWTRAGAIHCFKSHTAQARLLNMKGNTAILTPQGSPAFTAFTGITPDGNSANYFTRDGNGLFDIAGYNAQSDAGWFMWLKNDSAQPERMGAYQGTGSAAQDFIYLQQGSGGNIMRMGSASSLGSPGDIGAGALVGMCRTSSTSVSVYQNGSLVGTETYGVSGADDTRPMTYMKPLAGNNGAVLAFEYIGKSLNTAQAASLNTRVATLLANIGL